MNNKRSSFFGVHSILSIFCHLSTNLLSTNIIWDQDILREGFKKKKIPHRNRSQVQVSLKVTAQIDHLNITVTLDFFLVFDIFSID